MCILENHEDDLPVFLQYDAKYGFGHYEYQYGPFTFVLIDYAFITAEELGYANVIAWMDIPEYKGEIE